MAKYLWDILPCLFYEPIIIIVKRQLCYENFAFPFKAIPISVTKRSLFQGNIQFAAS